MSDRHDVDSRRHELLLHGLGRLEDGVVLFALRDGAILYANKGLVELFGCEDHDEFERLTGGVIDGLGEPAEIEHAVGQARAQVEHGRDSFSVDLRIRTSQGDQRMVVVRGRLEADDELGSCVVALFSRFDAGVDLRGVDGLTGLPRTHAFLSRVSDAFSSAREAGGVPGGTIVFFNIVNFKAYNVAYGLDAGDVFLIKVANRVRYTFPGDVVGRISDDHFAVYTTRDDVDERVRRVISLLAIDHPELQIEMKAGLYRCDGDATAGVSCDRARLACDSIKNEVGVGVAVYDPALSERVGLRRFASCTIDEAIERGHIKVYFQPVIRSLSGNLCGFEALARWDDPERGLLSPGVFIEELESSRQIDKLDCHVIHEVCRAYRRRADAGEVQVPVSLNLSRLDFALRDMFEVVEAEVTRYDVPRDMLHIEITESVLVSDGIRMSEVIRRFREAGFQVWMDDFGSGYSSLNVLKDYEFDELKIDMVFLTSFTERSRDIIASTVDMAKTIGVQTLAEGVETQEQFEFLRSIGCEKVQGYLFGAPLPYERTMEHCRSLGLKVETAAWRNYFDEIGHVDLMTDKSMCLMEFDGEDFSILFCNEGYRRIVSRREDDSISDIEGHLNASTSILRDKFIGFVQTPIATGEEEVITYIEHGDYIRYTFRLVAHNAGRYMFCCYVANMSADTSVRARESMDFALRSLYLLYDAVYLISIATRNIQALLSGAVASGPSPDEQSLADAARRFLEEVFPEDRQRFAQFSDPDSAMERLNAARDGKCMAYFRIRGAHGTYSWKLFTLARVLDEDDMLLLSIQASAINDREAFEFVAASMGLSASGESPMAPEILWDNLMLGTHIKYFWKDRERRFVGASRSFLDFYGFASLDEIVGKTDEDMGWHVDNEPFRDDELAVIEEGKRFFDAPGKCIVRGVVHNIVANKFPLYQDGKVVGLIGYFVDADAMPVNQPQLADVGVVDAVTGVTSARGLWETMLAYTEDYFVHGSRFATIVIAAAEYLRLCDEYGDDVGKRFLREVSKRLVALAGASTTVARLYGSAFVILMKYEAMGEVERTAQAACDAVSDIREVAGISCTVRARAGIVYEDEATTVDGLVNLAVERAQRGSTLKP